VKDISDRAPLRAYSAKVCSGFAITIRADYWVGAHLNEMKNEISA
jgi:hypothetical protein